MPQDNIQSELKIVLNANFMKMPQDNRVKGLY